MSVMTPMASDTDFTPDSWDFNMGDDIFIATIVDNSTTRKVDFPKGDDWVDWWNNQTYTGGSSQVFQVPLENFTVFKRKGMKFF
jgi:alpha-glucosidase (family GH31 glycosyl hydrolase)